MTQRTRAFGMAFMTLAAGGAIAAAKPAQNIAVTSTVAGISDSTYQIASDGGGPYINATNLKSLITPAGDYQLGGLEVGGTMRLVSLNFDMPVAGSGPNGGSPVSPPAGLYNVNLASPCSDVGLSILQVGPGNTIECGMNVIFTYDNQTYQMHMNGNATYPATNPVAIRCGSGAGKPCSMWTIEPSATTGYNVVNLALEVTGKHGVITEVNQGNFLMSFLITITNP